MTIRSTGTAATDRPARYGKQLTSHLGRRNGGEWDDATAAGWIQFPSARAELQSFDDQLVITLESPDEETADTMEDVIAKHLVRFSPKEPVELAWERVTLEAPNA